MFLGYFKEKIQANGITLEDSVGNSQPSSKNILNKFVKWFKNTFSSCICQRYKRKRTSEKPLQQQQNKFLSTILFKEFKS